jgi:hypothetical protein
VTAGSDPGEEDGRRADLAAFVESQWPEWEREGIGPDEGTIVSAAAVGLVELVWRNSPLEDMHADGGLRGRGPSDGEMFAESVALYRVARDALFRGTNAALLGVRALGLGPEPALGCGAPNTAGDGLRTPDRI